jgi:hypothetical protein
MIYPLLRLIATRPQLLLDHCEAYADLVVAEATLASAHWSRKAVLTLAAACSLGVALILTGVAVMIWAVTPVITQPITLALTGAPLVPWILALGCVIAARSRSTGGNMEVLRQQLSADMALLREKAGS